MVYLNTYIRIEFYGQKIKVYHIFLHLHLFCGQGLLPRIHVLGSY